MGCKGTATLPRGYDEAYKVSPNTRYHLSFSITLDNYD